MKLRLSPTDLTEAGITDMTPEQLTIEKMIEGIAEAPVPFLIDITTLTDHSKDLSLYDPGKGYDEVFFTNAVELIDALFEAYQFVVGYEGE